jgi:hypothetical protein
LHSDAPPVSRVSTASGEDVRPNPFAMILSGLKTVL